MSSPDDVERPLRVPEATDARRLADFLQAVIRTAAEGICIFTPIAEFPFIRISVWNDQMIELTGFTVAEINERGWHAALFPDPHLQQLAADGMKELIAGLDLGQVEWPITRKDGTERLLAVSSSRVQADDGPTIVILATDITDRRIAEAALRRSEVRLVEAQRAAGLGSWEWDVRSGAVWWSDELYRRYGKDPAIFQPTLASNLEVVHPDDRDRVKELLTTTLRDSSATHSEHRFEFPDGSIGWSQMHALVERDADETPVRMWGTCQDITDRKRAAEARQALEDRLREARRLESIGVLTGGMAHEFNNLLTLILGHVDLATAELPPNSPLLTHLVPMRTAGLRAAELCRQMLAYAGKSRLVMGSIQLAPLIADVTNGLATEAPIDLELNAELPPVRGDVEQLRQLVGNLLTNAAEAVSGSNGRVRLATYEHGLNAQAAARLRFTPGLLPNRYVALEVGDDGPGMDEVTLTRAFEPFFSTKFPGRGLGLPVVLGVLRTHGGGLDVETTPGRGTTFRAFLPIAKS